MVLEELKRRSDPVTQWMSARREVFIEIDGVQFAEATRILGLYPRLAEQQKGRNTADPFVIALATLSGLVCVTEEGFGTPSGSLLIRRWPAAEYLRVAENLAGLGQFSGLPVPTRDRLSGRQQSTARNVSIPYVCGELSVECINILEILKREKVRFIAEAVA
jgi:hypothetical protein